MTSTFNTLNHLTLSTPPLPLKHWSQTSHETILISNNNNQSIQLPLAGGAEHGQFIYFNEPISLLKNRTSTSIIKGGKTDQDEIILDIDQYKISGFTLADTYSLINTLSSNGKQIKLKTVKTGLTKDLRQFLDGRFEKGSIDYDLQQTIRDNVYMRTVPCTTRPPRTGEINGQDYTFLSVKDFRALEKSGNLLESGVYKGHYYGTPRPTKGSIMTTNKNSIRRSNSANEMFQNNENISSNLSGEFIKSSLKKGPNGFGFTIIGGYEKGEQFLQIKDILSDGPAAKEGKLRRGDILVSINDANVLGYTHTDVVKIFQSLSIGDIIHITVCRGYPLAVNFDDPQIDVVSLNGVHHLPNGGYQEYQGDQNNTRIYAIKIRKGDHGFGFTIADSLAGQRVKSIVDRQRCQNLNEDDLLLSINGVDLTGKHHHDVVDILTKCPKDIETIFVIRRGDPDVNNNSCVLNGNNHIQSNNRTIITGKHVSFLTNNKEDKENNETDTYYAPVTLITEKPRSKTPTSFGSTPLSNTLPFRSRTPLPTTSTNNNNNNNFSIGTTQDQMYSFDRQATVSRSARDMRSVKAPSLRSKTPGPEFYSTTSTTQYAHTMKPRSKTPTAYELSSNSLHNSRSLQSVHPPYLEIVVNLTLLRATEGFGLRIIGGEEEKSQVSIGHIVPNSPADLDGRLCIGDEIIKIDNHSTIRASHEKVVQLMQRAKEHQHVCLIIRRYTDPNQKTNSYPIYHSESHKKPSIVDNGIRYVTLQKTNENQSFGFVIISAQNKVGATVGKIIPNSPADKCGQLHLNDRILAVNGIDLTHMAHTDVVNLIKDSGRTITLTIGPSIQNEEEISKGIRPSLSSPTVISNGNNQSLKNIPEKSSSRKNDVLKFSPLSEDYFLVNLQRPSVHSSFGFSIRGGREFSIPLFILKIAENGPADIDGRMKPGDQIIEINGCSTYGMTHGEAILLIRDGGLHVRLLLRNRNAPPPSLDEVQTAMGTRIESPHIHWKTSGYT